MEPHEYASMYALEEHYWWYRALRQRILEALVSWGGLPAAEDSHVPPRCLDAGCGTGMLLAALGQGARAIGLDLSADALRHARRRGLSQLLRASVSALPVRSGAFDLLVSADVLYHRGVADDLAALDEAARCLRPGGLLVINLPAFAWLHSSHDEAIHTARRYTAGDVRGKLRRAGLTPLQVGYWNTLLFVPFALVRLARRGRSGRGPADERAAPQSDLMPLPVWLNRLLAGVLAVEARLFPRGAAFGLSVLAVARKEEQC